MGPKHSKFLVHVFGENWLCSSVIGLILLLLMNDYYVGIGAMKPNTIVLGFQDSHTVYNFLHSTDSPYYMHDNHMFPAPRELSHLDAFQYVSMIEDTLRMNKNICLCRNFQKLNKNSVAR